MKPSDAVVDEMYSVYWLGDGVGYGRCTSVRPGSCNLDLNGFLNGVAWTAYDDHSQLKPLTTIRSETEPVAMMRDFTIIPDTEGWIADEVTPTIPRPVCECGSTKAKLPIHSDWCPIYEPST